MKNIQNKELGFETFRADISGFNPETNTLDVVFATENPIMLQGYKYSDKFETFNEILKCDNESVRVDALSIGIPFFPDHWSRSSKDILGKTISYSINAVEKNCTATIQFGARMDEATKSDLQSGILNTVSVGVNIYKVMRSEIEGNITYTALDWKPKHIALAPEPADYGATTVRSGTQVEGLQETKPIIEKDLLKNIFTKNN